ncbi:MAG: hypothetical protein WD768_04130 [Phycisphaeraceae bacterium]
MSDTPDNKNETATLHGKVPPLASAQERNAALDLAFDYRGDVTIETTDGRAIEGYIFDRRNDIAEPLVRILPKDSDQRVSVKYSEIARLIFSGRDTAAGKSWETWVKKYNEKKAKGEEASIHSEPLE